MMNKLVVTVLAAVMLASGNTVYASHGANHALAGGIVAGAGALVGGVIAATRPAAPVVVATPAPVVATPVVTTAPVATTTVVTPGAYTYTYYNGVYCPTYSGYYYYNNAWVWGGPLGGYRPPMPLWRPHPWGGGVPRGPGGFHPGPGGHHGGVPHGGPHGGGHHHR